MGPNPCDTVGVELSTISAEVQHRRTMRHPEGEVVRSVSHREYLDRLALEHLLYLHGPNKLSCRSGISASSIRISCSARGDLSGPKTVLKLPQSANRALCSNAERQERASLSDIDRLRYELSFLQPKQQLTTLPAHQLSTTQKEKSPKALTSNPRQTAPTFQQQLLPYQLSS